MVQSKTGIAILIIVSVASLILAIGGSVMLSLYVAQNTKNQICFGFEYFIRPPTGPVSPVKLREEKNYNNLLIFEKKIGCTK